MLLAAALLWPLGALFVAAKVWLKSSKYTVKPISTHAFQPRSLLKQAFTRLKRI